MSFPYSPRLQDAKFESLQTQHEFLNLLRLRHLQWMNSAEEPEVKQVHLEIAELIEQITGRYDHLLEDRRGSRSSSTSSEATHGVRTSKYL
jgi:hypothetical protein